MKLFKTFRLDTENHLLWRNGDRVPVAPKAFEVLTYLVEHAGRVVPQDEMLDALWPETHVNAEVLRKYILEIRKALGDRFDNPEFIETLPKRGYLFVASVIEEHSAAPPDVLTPSTTDEHATDKRVGSETLRSERKIYSHERPLWKLAVISVLTVATGAAIARYFLAARNRSHAPSLRNLSIAVLPFVDMSPAQDQEYFSDGLAEQLINDLTKVSA